MKSLAPSVVALLGALTVAGCTTVGPTTSTSTSTSARMAPAAVASGVSCTGGEKPVTVNQFTIAPSGDTATVKLNPGRRMISPSGDGVRWQLSGNQLEFTSDGVSFGPPNYNAQPPAGAVIGSGHGNNKGQFVVCFGATTGLQTWYYNLKFYDKDKPDTVWICDPTIVNSATLLDKIDDDATCRLVK